MKNKYKSYGKIILIGEHSVLYNYKAISIPFNKVGVVVEIDKYDKLYIDSILYNGILNEKTNNLLGLYQMLLEFQKDYNFDLKLKIKITSNILEEKGMGSSAAVSSAVIKGVFDYYQIKLNNEEILKYVKISEDIYHINSSGIDASTVVYNKPILFQKGKIKKLDFKLFGYLLVVDSKTKSQTKKAVLKVQKLKPTKLLSELGMLTNNFIKGMKNIDYQLVNQTINNAQTILKKLGLSNKNIDDIVDKANSNNLSAKLTGGGLGGLVIVYSENLDKLQKFKHNLDYPSYDIINLGELDG